ncbi:Ubiquitin-conjugating enzyme E2 Z [Hondaea fermentalgiana]|uniref:Ubiquitin-conjugating enzyme E2 Z n=1 Tax=Hondaea fermentalgiana TaxID=2315210 RepID=A0A2R5GYN2_9STRA|nr:Ubiquitin-conjugating enzyme E2 Z [Hondaea fermentalgiana]|eukprot:GBG33843.1 Ubiquitin-conjugating enzyme E2 Z [Hondaea fermentalgiana]
MFACEPLLEADGDADPQLYLVCGRRTVSVVDAHAGDQLRSFELPPVGDAEPAQSADVHCVSLPATRQCFIGYGNRILPVPVPRSGESPVGFIIAMQGLIKAFDGSGPALLRDVDNQFAKPSAKNDKQTVYLEATAALFLYECLLAQMRAAGTPVPYRARVRKCRLLEQLQAELTRVREEEGASPSSSAKARQWRSVVQLEVPQYSMLHVCRTLQPVLEDSCSTALPAVISIIEQLHDLMVLPSNLSSFFATPGEDDADGVASTALAQLGMHLERERFYSLCTMHEDDARLLGLRTDGTDIRMARLAAAGFFYQRGPSDRSGKFFHFESGVTVAVTSALARRLVLSPAIEHALMAPASRFVLRKITANVPIAESKGSSDRVGLFAGQNIQDDSIEDTVDWRQGGASAETDAPKDADISNTGIDKSASEEEEEGRASAEESSRAGHASDVEIGNAKEPEDPITLIRACPCPKTPVIATATSSGSIFVWIASWHGMKKSFSFHATGPVEASRPSSSKSSSATPFLGANPNEEAIPSEARPVSSSSSSASSSNTSSTSSRYPFTPSDLYRRYLAKQKREDEERKELEAAKAAMAKEMAAARALANRVCAPTEFSDQAKASLVSKWEQLRNPMVKDICILPKPRRMAKRFYRKHKTKGGAHGTGEDEAADSSVNYTAPGSARPSSRALGTRLGSSSKQLQWWQPGIVVNIISGPYKGGTGYIIEGSGIDSASVTGTLSIWLDGYDAKHVINISEVEPSKPKIGDAIMVLSSSSGRKDVGKLVSTGEAKGYVKLRRRDTSTGGRGRAPLLSLQRLMDSGSKVDKNAVTNRKCAMEKIFKLSPAAEIGLEQQELAVRNEGVAGECMLVVLLNHGSDVDAQSSALAVFRRHNRFTELVQILALEKPAQQVISVPKNMLVHVTHGATVATYRLGYNPENVLFLDPRPASHVDLGVPCSNVHLSLVHAPETKFGELSKDFVPFSSWRSSGPASGQEGFSNRSSSDAIAESEQMGHSEQEAWAGEGEQGLIGSNGAPAASILQAVDNDGAAGEGVGGAGVDSVQALPSTIETADAKLAMHSSSSSSEEEEEEEDDDDDDEEDEDEDDDDDDNEEEEADDDDDESSANADTATPTSSLPASAVPPMLPSTGTSKDELLLGGTGLGFEAETSDSRNRTSGVSRSKQMPSTSSYWLAALCPDGTLLMFLSSMSFGDAGGWKFDVSKGWTSGVSDREQTNVENPRSLVRLSHATTSSGLLCCAASENGQIIASRLSRRSIINAFTSSDEAFTWLGQTINDLDTVTEQLQWEHLPFRAFPPLSGRQRVFSLGRSGSMLRWRIQGHLGANGLETDAEADDDDEDVLIDATMGGPARAEGGAPGTKTAAGNRIDVSAPLEWELELPEPAAVSRLFVHVDLQMRQTTAASPALQFLGIPGGCARASLRPHLTEDGGRRFLTIEAWVKPAWVSGASDDVHHKFGVNDFVPIVHKSTMGPNGEILPQYEVSVNRAGRAEFRVWKDDDIVFSTSVLKGVGTSQPELRPDEWHHVAAIVGRSGLELYIDGDLYAASELTRVSIRPDMDANQSPAGMAGSVSTNPVASTPTLLPQGGPGRLQASAYRYGALCIGGDGVSRNFSGYLRHVRLWAMARTQEQVRDWMHHSVGPSVPTGHVAPQTAMGGNGLGPIPREDLRVQVDADDDDCGPRSKVESILSLGESANLVGCWPLTEPGEGGALPVHQGTVDEASEATLSDPALVASWVDVQVPLVDFKPSLTLSASLLDASGTKQLLVAQQPLEGCEVSFDLGARVGTRVCVKLFPSPNEQLATVTGVSLSLKGRLATTAERYREHLLTVDRGDASWLPLSSLSVFWNLCLRADFTRSLVDLATSQPAAASEMEAAHSNQTVKAGMANAEAEDLGAAPTFSTAQEEEEEARHTSEKVRLGALRLLEYQLEARVTHFVDCLDAPTLEKFMRENFVEAPNTALGAEVAEQSGALLLHLLNACDPEELLALRGSILDLALQVLGDASNQAQTVEGLEQLVALIARCWPVKGTKLFEMAFTSVMEQLCTLGDQLDKFRSPHHNMLRTFFTNFTRPLNEPFVPHGRGCGPLLRGDFAELPGQNSDTSSSGSGGKSSRSSRSSRTPRVKKQDGSRTSNLQGAAIAAAVSNAANASASEGIDGSVSIHSKTSNASHQVIGDSRSLDHGGSGSGNAARLFSPNAKHAASAMGGAQSNRGGDESSVQITFGNVLLSQKDSIMVLNLGDYCTITSLSAVPFVERFSPWMSGMLTVEAWRSHPPVAGDRSLIKAHGVEVELYAFSGNFSYDRDGTIGVKSHFPTVVPRNVMLYSGKWYYEVLLVKTGEGVAQIGWADAAFQGSDDDSTGTGDDEHSWAYDGQRQKKWNNGSTNWGSKWHDGFIVGCAADIDGRVLSFSLNGSWSRNMGTAFKNIKITGGLFPAITGERNFKCQINLGQKPFAHAPPNGHRPVFDWIKQNRHIVESNGMGKALTTAEVYASQRASPISDLTGLAQSSLSSEIYTHAQSAPLLSTDFKDTRFVGRCEARYLRIIFSPHNLAPTIPAMVLYSRAPLPAFKDVAAASSEDKDASKSSQLRENAKLLSSSGSLIAEDLLASGHLSDTLPNKWGHDTEEDEEEDEEAEDSDSEDDHDYLTKSNEAYQDGHGSLGTMAAAAAGVGVGVGVSAGFSTLKASASGMGAVMDSESNSEGVQGDDVVDASSKFASACFGGVDEDLTSAELEGAFAEMEALRAAWASGSADHSAARPPAAQWLTPAGVNSSEKEEDGSEASASGSPSPMSSSALAATASWLEASSAKMLAKSGSDSSDNLPSISKVKDFLESIVENMPFPKASEFQKGDLGGGSLTSKLRQYKAKAGLTSSGHVKHAGLVASGSSSSKRRSRQTQPDAKVVVKLSVEGIRDSVPMVRALPDKLRSTFLVDHKSTAETRFVSSLAEVERARRSLELALERFSGNIGTATGGVWDGIDTSRMSWDEALEALGDQHPLYNAVAAVRAALVDGVLAALGESEEARERLDYLQAVITQIADEEYSARMAAEMERAKGTPENHGNPTALQVAIRDDTPTFLESVELLRPTRQPSVCVSRWFRMVELLTNLLVRKFPDEAEDDVAILLRTIATERRPFLSLPLLHKVFSHFCVHHTCSAEQIRVTGKLVRRGLRALSLYDEGASARFTCDVLREHFSTPSVFLGISQSFPERPVFNLLKAIVEGPDASLAVEHLLRLLDSIGSGNVASVLDNFPLVSWTLVLLSHALESEARVMAERALLPASVVSDGAKAVHPNTLCEGAERYPDPTHIFLKIPRPLPLPPTSDQPSRLPVGPLLPGLRTLLPSEADAQAAERQARATASETMAMANEAKLAAAEAAAYPTWGQSSAAKKTPLGGKSAVLELGGNSDSEESLQTEPKESVAAGAEGDSAGTSSDTGVVHHGTACDGCGMKPIVGVRFKCVNCDEYDLCARCESEQQARRAHFALHVFVKLRSPLPDESDKNSEALIPEQALVATLLHPSVYHRVRRAEQELDVMLGARDAGGAISRSTGSGSGSVGLGSGESAEGASGTGGKSVAQSVLLSLDGDDPGLIKLARRRSHILNTSGRFGKPSVLNPFHAAFSTSDSSVLDSPPSRRVRGTRFFAGLQGSGEGKHDAELLKVAEEDDDERTDDGEGGALTNGPEDTDALRVILGLITSPALLAPLQLELFLITAKVLEQLVGRASHESVRKGVLEHPLFDELLRRIADLSEPFVHSSILRIVEVLCSKSGSSSVRALLREKIIKVLDPPPQTPVFVLELLLIALGSSAACDPEVDAFGTEPEGLSRAVSESQGVSSSLPLRRNVSAPGSGGGALGLRRADVSNDMSGEPVRAVDHDAAPLEDVSPGSLLREDLSAGFEKLDARSVARVLGVFRNAPLRSAPRARAWAFAFRILRKFCEPEAMLLGEGKTRLDLAIQSVLAAGGAMVALLETDVVMLVRSLLSSSRGHVHVIFQQGLLDMLVNAFLVASPVNPRLYRRIVLALTDSFTSDADAAAGLDEGPLISLMEAVSTAIGTEAHMSSEALAKPDLDLLREVLELVCSPLRKAYERSDAAATLRRALLSALTTSRDGAPAPVHNFLGWLSDPPKSSEPARAARQRLSEMIVLLLSEVLGREDDAAAPLLDICVSALRDPHAGHPEPVAAVIYALISREALATHLVLSRAGLELGVQSLKSTGAVQPSGLLLESDLKESVAEDSFMASRTRARIMATVSQSICQALGTAVPVPMSRHGRGGSNIAAGARGGQALTTGSSLPVYHGSGSSFPSLPMSMMSSSASLSASTSQGGRTNLPECLAKHSANGSYGGSTPFDISSRCAIRRTSGHPSGGNGMPAASAEKVRQRLERLICVSEGEASAERKVSSGYKPPSANLAKLGHGNVKTGNAGSDYKSAYEASLTAGSAAGSVSKSDSSKKKMSFSQMKSIMDANRARAAANAPAPVSYVFGRGSANGKWFITIEFPCDSIVHAVEFDFNSDVLLSTSSSTLNRRSELPSRVAVETGTSLSRMSPAGITSSFSSKMQAERTVGTASICLAAPVTARFLRVAVFAPPETDLVPLLAPKTLAETTGHTSSTGPTRSTFPSTRHYSGVLPYAGKHPRGSSNEARTARTMSKAQQAFQTRPLPGDLVVRGPDWKWAMQDGGLGTRGKVLEMTSWGGMPGKAVRVKWPSGTTNAYRWGYVEHGEPKYDLMHVPKKEPNRQRVVILDKLGIYCTTLQPTQARSGLMCANQRSLALFLELCATACRNFVPVQMDLAHSETASQLASALSDFIPGPQTSRHARAIIGMLAKQNSQLASSLLRSMLGPVHSLTPAHAALAAEMCIMNNQGVQGRIRLLWDFVTSNLRKGEQSPMLLPFFQALALAVEQYSVSNGGDYAAQSSRLDFLVSPESSSSSMGDAPCALGELVELLIAQARSATASAPAEQAALTLLCALLRCDTKLRSLAVEHLELMVNEVLRVTEEGTDFLSATQVSAGHQSQGSQASEEEDIESVSSARSRSSQDAGRRQPMQNADIVRAQSALKIFGTICSCHPEMVRLTRDLLDSLATQVVPTMRAVHTAERSDEEIIISSLSMSKTDEATSSSALAHPRAARQTLSPAASDAAPPSMSAPAPTRVPSVSAELERAMRTGSTPSSVPNVPTPPLTPRSRALQGARSSRSFGLRGAGGRASFNSRKRVCETLHLLLQKTLYALSDASCAEPIKTYIGEGMILETVLEQLIEFDRAKTAAQAELKQLNEALSQSRSSSSRGSRLPKSTQQGITSFASGGGAADPSKSSGEDSGDSGKEVKSGSTTSLESNSKLLKTGILESPHETGPRESLSLSAASQAAVVRVCEPWDACHEAALDLVKSCLNLHPANQSRVADLLARQIDDKAGMSNFVVKILTDVAVLVPKVAVSIWRPRCVVEEIVNGALIGGGNLGGGSSMDTEEVSFRLDPDNCGSTISVSDDGMSATQVSFEKWGMVRADMEIPSTGVSRWDVSIDISSKGHIFVGVATAASNLGSYLGNDKYGWGYIGNKGAWHNKHKVKTYGRDFRTGHVVTVIMDMNEGVLSFAVNGEDLGIAFDDGLKGKQLYPAFALYQKGDCFTVTSCSMAKVKASMSSALQGLSLGSSGLLDATRVALSGAAGADLGAMEASGDLTSRLRFHRSGPVYTLPAKLLVHEMLQLGGVLGGPDTIEEGAEENVRRNGPEQSPPSSSSSLPRVQESQRSPLSSGSPDEVETWDDNKPQIARTAPVVGQWGVLMPQGVMLVEKLTGYTLCSLVAEAEFVDLIRTSELPSSIPILDETALTELAKSNAQRAMAPQSILRKLADMGGLAKLAKLSRVRLDLPAREELTEESRAALAAKSVSIDTIATGPVETRAVTWASWLDRLQVYFGMVNFDRTFVNDKDCMGLLFALLGVDAAHLSDDKRGRIEPSEQALEDPDGALFVALSKHFARARGKAAAESRKWAVQHGVLDSILLRIGRIQAEEPRDPERAARFADPFTTQASTTAGRTGNAGADNDAESSSSPSASATVRALPSRITSKIRDFVKEKPFKSSKESDKSLWAPGYGHGSTDTSVSDRMREKQQQEKTDRTLATMSVLTSFLNTSKDADDTLNDDVWAEVAEVLEASCLLRVLMSFLFGNTIKVVLDNLVLYRALLRFVYVLAQHPQLARILCPVEGVYRSVQQLMEELEDLVEDLSEEDETEEGLLAIEDDEDVTGETSDANLQSETSHQDMAHSFQELQGASRVKSGGDEAKSEGRSLLADICDLPFKDMVHTVAGAVKKSVDAFHERERAAEEAKQALEQEKAAKAGTNPGEDATNAEEAEQGIVSDAAKDGPKDGASTEKDTLDLDESEAVFTRQLNQIYEAALRPELFGSREMADEDGRYNHHYRTHIEDDIKGKVSQTRMRRLNRELKALRKSLPLHFNSSIALRVDQKRPFVAQCIIFAPDNTPYDSGCFQFDIYFPPEYPSEPPKMNLMTTGGGSVRFNPNLYNNGKVCLSLLGTWRGGATGSENWTKNSSLWQVLVSIQSAILGSEFPYFNEPGVESQWGTEQGELQKRIHSNGGYERLRVATLQHAMLSQLRNPPPGFETLIQEHFRIKKHHILATVDRWVEEAKLSDTKSHLKSISKFASDLREELDKLPSEEVDALYSEREERLKELRAKEQERLEHVKLLSAEDTDAGTAGDAAAGVHSASFEDAQGGEPSSKIIGNASVGSEALAATGWTSKLDAKSGEMGSSATLNAEAALAEENLGGGVGADSATGQAGASALDAGQLDFAHALQSMIDMCPTFPRGLLRHALTESRDEEFGNVNVDAALTWVLSEGEDYLNKHLELYMDEHQST